MNVPWDRILAVADRLTAAYKEQVALNRDQAIHSKRQAGLSANMFSILLEKMQRSDDANE